MDFVTYGKFTHVQQKSFYVILHEMAKIKNISNNIKRNQAIAILKDRNVAVAKKEWLAKLKDQAYIEYVR